MEQVPYVLNYNKLPKYFEKIIKADTPETFTIQHLTDVLGFKSNNDRIFVKFLKQLGFLDSNGVPTAYYKEFRNPSSSGQILAKGLKQAYSQFFKRDKDANQLSEQEINGMIKSITGLGDDSQIPKLSAKTFKEAVKLAKFEEQQEGLPPHENIPALTSIPSIIDIHKEKNLEFTYTITLNLPSTTNQEVYDTIFKSLKENLLGD